MTQQLLCKITNKYENHHGFQYNDGLNVLQEPFTKEGSCVAGGFYFTDSDNIYQFLDYGCNIRIITIPSDAQIVPDGIKWRTDKIIFGKKYPLFHPNTFKRFPFLESFEYWIYALRWACENGHLDIAKWCVDHNSMHEINNALGIACENGHFEIAKWCVEQGATNFNTGLKWACKGGHFEIAKWCVEQGANDFNTGLEYACYSGQFDIKRWCIE